MSRMTAFSNNDYHLEPGIVYDNLVEQFSNVDSNIRSTPKQLFDWSLSQDDQYSVNLIMSHRVVRSKSQFFMVLNNILEIETDTFPGDPYKVIDNEHTRVIRKHSAWYIFNEKHKYFIIISQIS